MKIFIKLFTLICTILCTACSTVPTEIISSHTPTEIIISHTPNINEPPKWISEELGKQNSKYFIIGFVEEHGEDVRASAVERMAERDALAKLSEAIESRISSMTETFEMDKKINSKSALRLVSKNILRGSTITKKYWQRVQLSDERTITRAWAQLTIDESRFKKLMIEALEHSHSKGNENGKYEKEFFEKAERVWDELN